MTVADNVRSFASEAEPVIEQWLNAAVTLAGLRDAAKEQGINWTQLKAILVAKARDNEDGGDRLAKLTENHDLALEYADMIGNRKVAEENKLRHIPTPSPDFPTSDGAAAKVAASGGMSTATAESAVPRPPAPAADSTNSSVNDPLNGIPPDLQRTPDGGFVGVRT